MAEFINTIDILGDNAVIDSIIDRTITEFKDDKLTSVGDYAFHKCTNLKTVSLPNCEKVKLACFFDCTGLEELSLPNLTSASGGGGQGGSSFTGCSSLKTVYLPKLTEVAQELFSGAFADGTSVCLPSVTKCGARAFHNSRLRIIDLPVCTTLNGITFYICTSLIALILRNTETVCTTDNANPFAGNYAGANGPIAKGEGYIYVPRALVDSYKVATNWSTYASQFRALEDYTVDGTTTGALDESKI